LLTVIRIPKSIKQSHSGEHEARLKIALKKAPNPLKGAKDKD